MNWQHQKCENKSDQPIVHSLLEEHNCNGVKKRKLNLKAPEPKKKKTNSTTQETLVYA